jgi:hypothetical protein
MNPILSTAGPERRLTPRRDLRMKALWRRPGTQFVEVRTLDISTTGIGLISDINVPEGETCAVLIALPVAPGRSVNMQITGTVAHCILNGQTSQYKIGVSFVQLPPQTAAAIKAFVSPPAS